MKHPKEYLLAPMIGFRPQSMTLLIHDPQDGLVVYEIGCEENFKNSSDMFDTILQVSGKAWVNSALIGNLIKALNVLSHICFGETDQGAFCPGGKHVEINWPSRVSKERVIAVLQWFKDLDALPEDRAICISEIPACPPL